MLPVLFAACADPSDPPPEAACVPASEAEILERRGDYYRCLDRTLQDGAGCGPDGYPLGYGAKYADRYFDDAYPRLTDAGQAFFRAVSPCLQERMAAEVAPDWTCAEVWDHGFDTHLGCYLDAGFCGIPGSDVVEIAGVLDPEDSALPEVADLFVALTEACSG
ncbi:MAG: hypothetical protein ABMB14_26705 [Myxococcota bacterium]